MKNKRPKIKVGDDRLGVCPVSTLVNMNGASSGLFHIFCRNTPYNYRHGLIDVDEFMYHRQSFMRIKRHLIDVAKKTRIRYENSQR